MSLWTISPSGQKHCPCQIRKLANFSVNSYIVLECHNEILTDQGAKFQSTLFTELASLLDMDKTRISAYHPMANGLVE